jgi:hypothetical protein
MSKSNTFENEYQLHVFNNEPIPNVGDANGVLPSVNPGNLYLSLHTSDPGESGTQATSEIAYTGYARQAVPRSPAGFSVSGATVTLANNVDFPEMTGGVGGTVTYFSVGKMGTGATDILYSGTVTPNILIQVGVTGRLKNLTSITED